MRLNPHQQICKYWEKWNEHPAITSGVHSIWEEEDSGTHREPHGESASGQRWERDGASPARCCQCLGTCWVVIILQVPPATAVLIQPAKETSEIIPWLLLYRFESCWRQLCLLGYILNPCPNCSCTRVTPKVLHTQSDQFLPCLCFASIFMCAPHSTTLDLFVFL